MCKVKGFISIKLWLRKTLGVFFLLICKVFIFKTRFCGVKHFTKHLKFSDKLFILAPGASINNITENEFLEISSHDSIGLNYFIFHDFVPTSYLIETHNTDVGYFDYVACNILKLSKVPFLYKGYNSPKKILEFIKNLYVLRTAKLERFYLMKDAYKTDNKIGPDDSGVYSNIRGTKDDYFYHDIASLLYVLNLGYLCGYKEVILCGFDMSEYYFYNATKYKKVLSKYPLLIGPKPIINLIFSNTQSVAKLLSKIEELSALFNVRQGKISQFKCEGRLNRVLKQYEMD